MNYEADNIAFSYKTESIQDTDYLLYQIRINNAKGSESMQGISPVHVWEQYIEHLKNLDSDSDKTHWLHLRHEIQAHYYFSVCSVTDTMIRRIKENTGINRVLKNGDESLFESFRESFRRDSIDLQHGAYQNVFLFNRVANSDIVKTYWDQHDFAIFDLYGACLVFSASLVTPDVNTRTMNRCLREEYTGFKMSFRKNTQLGNRLEFAVSEQYELYDKSLREAQKLMQEYDFYQHEEVQNVPLNAGLLAGAVYKDVAKMTLKVASLILAREIKLFEHLPLRQDEIIDMNIRQHAEGFNANSIITSVKRYFAREELNEKLEHKNTSSGKEHNTVRKKKL